MASPLQNSNFQKEADLQAEQAYSEVNWLASHVNVKAKNFQRRNGLERLLDLNQKPLTTRAERPL